MTLTATAAPLHRPASFGDVGYYPDDQLDLMFFFHNATGDMPVDVSGCAFSGKLFTEASPSLLIPTFDMAEAGAGKVRVSFTADQVSAFPRYVQMSVKESIQFRRTILLGRLTRADWYAPTSRQEPELVNQSEVLIRVAVQESSIPDGVTWAELGDITWAQLGDITWENI